MVLILVTFLAVSTAVSPLLALLQEGIGLNPEVLRLTTFATAVGAGAVWLIWRKKFTFPSHPRRQVLRVLVFSVFLAAVTTAILFALNVAGGALWPPLNLSNLPASLAVILFVQLLGAFGEEVGWRGVVQPLLENRFSVIWSGLLTGLLFGLGHFYVLLLAGPVVYLTFVIAAIGLSTPRLQPFWLPSSPFSSIAAQRRDGLQLPSPRLPLRECALKRVNDDRLPCP